jgi:tetratricopeptide (TPR) repeat protein
MNSAQARTPCESKAFGTARRVWAMLTAVAAVLATGAVGVSWWRWRHSAPVPEARAAAAQGLAYLRYGRPDLAFQSVREVVRDESPEAGEAMTVAGLALIRMGEHRAARLALERAIKLQPNQFEAAVTLGELNLDLGNGPRGVEAFEMAARLRPRAARVWLALARALHDLGDDDRTIQAYEKVLELSPSHREALLELIGTAIASGQSDLAERWVTKARQRYPDDPAVLGLAARWAVDVNHLDEAIRLANQALARDPGNVPALVARAKSHLAGSRWTEALLDAERAAAAAPNDVGILQLLMIIQHRAGLTERSAATRVKLHQVRERLAIMDTLADEIARRPDDPELPWKLGKLAWEGGQTQLASSCFEAATALDPNFQPARESLAALRASHPELAQGPRPWGTARTLGARRPSRPEAESSHAGRPRSEPATQ